MANEHVWADQGESSVETPGLQVDSGLAHSGYLLTKHLNPGLAVIIHSCRGFNLGRGWQGRSEHSPTAIPLRLSDVWRQCLQNFASCGARPRVVLPLSPVVASLGCQEYTTLPDARSTWVLKIQTWEHVLTRHVLYGWSLFPGHVRVIDA